MAFFFYKIRRAKKEGEESRNGLLSHRVAPIVPSALYSFTSRFGMGLGGTCTL